MEGKLRPWHYVLFAAAILAAAYGVYAALGGPAAKLKNEFYLADVQSGELFRYSMQKSMIVPAKNPDTGNASLFPVTKVDGKWKMTERYAQALDLSPVPPDAVDLSSLEVRVKDEDARRIDRTGGGKIAESATEAPKVTSPRGAN